jgi:hypothetical protein
MDPVQEGVLAGFTAEAVAKMDGEPVLLTVAFTISPMHPEDPREPGHGHVAGTALPAAMPAFRLLAEALEGGSWEPMGEPS